MTKEFKAPTQEEIEKYMNTLTSSFVASREAVKMFNYYHNNGWIVGKKGKPMKNYKLACLNWLRQRKKFIRPSKKIGSSFENTGLDL